MSEKTEIYFCLGINFLFINIASCSEALPLHHFSIHWTCLTCENDLAQSNTVCCANKHLDEILYLVTSFHYYSPLSFLLVLIWSSNLSIKLCKITANTFCDMAFCLRCLHFKPLNVYNYVLFFSLPKIKKKKENIYISGCTTKLGWKLFPLLACLEYCLFCLEVVCLAGHGTWYWIHFWGIIQLQRDLMQDRLSVTFTIQT